LLTWRKPQVSLGLTGEILVAQALHKRGYETYITHKNGDLLVYDKRGTALTVEVKTARKNSRGHYCWCLIKDWQGRRCCDHRKSDFTVLLCVLRTGNVVPFVLPARSLADRRSVAVTSNPRTYAGWLSAFRQSIDYIRL
jgi:hypothetical protein